MAEGRRLRIAVVGTGVAGMVSAHLIHARHELTVFESAAAIGGHVATIDVVADGRTWAVDTGFIVFNTRTYPRFVTLLDELGIGSRASEMSFSARADSDNVEYSGTGRNGLFAQRRNLARPAFWRMLRDILRFYREARELASPDVPGDIDPTLGEYLAAKGYSAEFLRWHLVPMASAVWSMRPSEVLDFPARTLVRFFENHGFLQLEDRPQWLTVPGGSREYANALCAPFADSIRVSTTILRVERGAFGVRLVTAAGEVHEFDRVVLACHAGQALRMLAEPTRAEREVLGALRTQANRVVLHTDDRWMPRRRRAWSAWNYRLGRDEASVTYWMNRLQGIETPTQFFVTLNPAVPVDPRRVLHEAVMHHPIYDRAAIRAQARRAEINGTGGVFYAGAYWGYGFHEDGTRSAYETCGELLA